MTSLQCLPKIMQGWCLGGSEALPGGTRPGRVHSSLGLQIYTSLSKATWHRTAAFLRGKALGLQYQTTEGGKGLPVTSAPRCSRLSSEQTTSCIHPRAIMHQKILAIRFEWGLKLYF